MPPRPEPLLAARSRANHILRILQDTYPDAHCALSWNTPLQLAIATILSAQCTDRRVNIVTPALFAAFPDAPAFAAAPLSDIESAIRSCGFYHNKAKAIQDLCTVLVRDHGGELPRDPGLLEDLPGIGRKTANLLRAELYDIPSLIVDTHFIRLSNRLGLLEAPTTDPLAIERRIQTLVPRPEWTHWSHLLVTHGRACCDARTPACSRCPVALLCPSAKRPTTDKS
jgi:endonuclease-3